MDPNMFSSAQPITTNYLKQNPNKTSEKIAQNIRIGGWHFIEPTEILFFEANVNYTNIYFANGKSGKPCG